MNGTTATFYKMDNGKMYNAVIDIWKTGVEKLVYCINDFQLNNAG